MMCKMMMIAVMVLNVLVVSAVCEAGEISPVLQTLLATTAGDEELRVIVKLRNSTDVQQYTTRDRRSRRRVIIQGLKDRFDQNMNRGGIRQLLQTFKSQGKQISRSRFLWMQNSVALSATAKQIHRVAGNPRVSSVRMDEIIYLSEMTAATYAQPEWNLSAIRAADLWERGYTGQGVVVAAMDSGVDGDHPDLVGSWRGGTNSWFDANDPNFDPLIDTQPYDLDGHGTAVMGIMVGGDAGGSSIGVAPGATWIAAKIFNASGTALESEIHAGFQWLLDPDGNALTDDAPDVVNNSWGFEGADQCYEGQDAIFRTDIQVLNQAGIAVVFAAGNSGPGLPSSESPANYPESLAVGAVNETLTVADFSSRGPSACDGAVFPDVVAPGDRAGFPFGIKTADLYFGFGDPYVYVMGTSVAAPHVSGAMALLIGAFPGVSPEDMKSAFRMSATDIAAVGADNDSGYGMIDIPRAYCMIGNCDNVSIADVTYDFQNQSLQIIAISDQQPVVQLAAEGFGPLGWKSWLGLYRTTFYDVLDNPGSVRVTSSAGGSAAYMLPQPDAVTIESLQYDAGSHALTVVATSDQQADVQLAVEGLGPLRWKTRHNFYRKTFADILIQPDSITVISSGGGSDTVVLLDSVTIMDIIYNASNDGTLTVIATSDRQPEVQLTAGGFGELKWKSWLNFYRNTFTGIGPMPDSVTVTSSSGGADVWTVGVE